MYLAFGFFAFLQTFILIQMCCLYVTQYDFETLKYRVGVQQASLTSWGESASLALVGHPSGDGVTIKMPYVVDFYIDQLCTPSFPIGLVETESGFIVRSVKTGLRT